MMSVKNEKWFEDMKDTEIVEELSRIAWNCVACAKQGEKSNAEKLHDEFIEKFNSVIPDIVEIKTSHWAYREYNGAYEKWDKCLEDIKMIKLSMVNNLYSHYKDEE